jgi:murein DD-endopeptidase MepM/ murein hydrolase activator NlpD
MKMKGSLFASCVQKNRNSKKPENDRSVGVLNHKKTNIQTFMVSIATSHPGKTGKVHFLNLPRGFITVAFSTIVVSVLGLSVLAYGSYQKMSVVQNAKKEHARIVAESNWLHKSEQEIAEQTADLTRTTIKYFMLAGLPFHGGYPYGGKSMSTQVLSNQLELLENRQRQLLKNIAMNTQKWLHTPSIPPANGHISSVFGYRKSPFSAGREFHEGLDIANVPGTPILATAAGKVVLAGRYMGYGNAVVLDHGYGVRTLYGHMSRILVTVGEKVKRENVIGRMGNTGLSTGPHVHYAVMVNDVPVNPERYMFLKSRNDF